MCTNLQVFTSIEVHVFILKDVHMYLRALSVHSDKKKDNIFTHIKLYFVLENYIEDIRKNLQKYFDLYYAKYRQSWKKSNRTLDYFLRQNRTRLDSMYYILELKIC